jgi:hypothetical protein
MRRILSFIQTTLSLAFFAAMVALCVGPSIYLDLKGPVVPAEVLKKTEDLDVRDKPDYTRRLQIQVRFQPLDQDYPEEAYINVDAGTYDSVHVGSQIQVRYQPNRSIRQIIFWPAARINGQTTLSVLRRLPQSFLFGAIVVGIGIALVWMLFKPRFRALRPVLALLLVVDLVGVGFVVVQPAFLGRFAGPQQTAKARVRAINYVTMTEGGSRTPSEKLRKPYDHVQLDFVPAGAVDPVIAIDDIDVGSLPTLRVGDTVTIVYPESNPRGARILGGTHDHRWINFVTWPIGLLGGLAAAVVSALLWALIMRLFSFVGKGLEVLGEGGPPEQQEAIRHLRRMSQVARGERPEEP